MNQALLVEILLEELPAKPLLQELPNMPDKWHTLLSAHGLSAPTEFSYTPTRLVLHTKDFPTHTPTSTTEHFGPPLSVGVSNNALNAIGRKFYEKLGLEVPSTWQSALKSNKEVLYVCVQIEPKPTAPLLDRLLLDFLQGLNFGKSMAWGDVKARFIRPIHNICVLFGDHKPHLPLCQETFLCTTKQATKLHFSMGFGWHNTPSIEGYFETLKKGKVLLDPKAREAKILKEIRALEQEHGLQVQVDSELLAEVVAITSYPTALYGAFAPKFLRLPPEITTTSMQEHQRYFATFKDGALHAGFVMVSNTPLECTTDFKDIVAGNEKVLKARLSDAMFFYENDLKAPFVPNLNALAQIAFVQGLGTLADKVQREQAIGRALAQKYAPHLQGDLEQAISLSKLDLLSEVVYEFPELQGIMGAYYAKAKGYTQATSTALKEQYLPNSENAPLPSSLLGALLSLSHKLDSLLALFSVGKIPTGSKDPFALRRACNALLRICLHFNLPFDLQTDFEALAQHYKSFDTALLKDFALERLSHILESTPNYSPNIYKAVLGGIAQSNGVYELCQIAKKVQALAAFLGGTQTRDFVAVFKRVANIIQEHTPTSPTNPKLFTHESEHALFSAYATLQATPFNSHLEQLHALFALKGPLEAFFDNVLVNDSNIEIQNNRKGLLVAIYRAFLGMAEAKEL
ncbi:glycine--tRNA ligase subunit beta [Helicobacter heilmannii]|uniref:Glycine--tRNA ligase beta subunit n=1 Tax=Helicobacter heilmannii TaxID=35817 RepID=A0A0K2YC59_HELHE|nr:glycine--tRNA ligase subunit beta [Helicobacter heilmannii]BDQ27867.1 glycine--tRNA ligase beta subunit [Helicobacter heilmannii]CCM11016.1 Glycyl-tRNA synthetase beta chain [Helicobacter heilmannii ASB1.4]CRI35289.1 Glycyl-tRNA synthetase beta chain [Helicobacter heilmannii]